uniref:Uncharacterized protein n=1 Tax=Anopheles melas TaxID=34690 RepID=A0A182U2W9_9DIPT
MRLNGDECGDGGGDGGDKPKSTTMDSKSLRCGTVPAVASLSLYRRSSDWNRPPLPPPRGGPPRPPPPPRPPRPVDSSTRARRPEMVRPSSPRTASSASRASSNSTNAKPGGLRATHTLRSGP